MNVRFEESRRGNVYLQCLVVVVGRVAATMTHDDRVIQGDFVQIGGIELALVFYLGVVEEISVHPRGVSFARPRSFSTMLAMVTNSTS